MLRSGPQRTPTTPQQERSTLVTTHGGGAPSRGAHSEQQRHLGGGAARDDGHLGGFGVRRGGGWRGVECERGGPATRGLLLWRGEGGGAGVWAMGISDGLAVADPMRDGSSTRWARPTPPWRSRMKHTMFVEKPIAATAVLLHIGQPPHTTPFSKRAVRGPPRPTLLWPQPSLGRAPSGAACQPVLHAASGSTR